MTDNKSLYNNIQNKLPFVAGKSNITAFNAVSAVFQKPSEVFNPVFVYGETGVGKTHLAVYLASSINSKNAIFISAEDYINDLIKMINDKDNLIKSSFAMSQAFAQELSLYDVIVIDNLHDLIGKEATQNAFYAFVKYLVFSRKQVVILSDTSLNTYSVLWDEFKRNFDTMLECEICKPDSDLKKKIIYQNSKFYGVRFENKAVKWLSDCSETLPYIIGAIKKAAISSDTAGKISLLQLKNIMKEN